MAKKRLKTGIAFTVLLIIIVAGSAGIYIYRELSSFVKTPLIKEAPEITFTVLRGQSLKTIAANLEKKGLISDSFYFLVYAKLQRAEKTLKAGEYTLSASKSPEEIFKILIKGQVKLYKITIQEGLTIKKIASLVEKNKMCNKEQFNALCYNSDFIKKLGFDDVPSLEGYLFPDTYFFSRHNTCEDIIIAMVGKFKSVFTPEWEAQADKLHFSIHEVVTLASIIEKETADDSERPLISSVFHNRLKKNMRLQSDPTAIYGLEDFSGKIRKKHIRAETPYNTYRIKGFPPGPIAGPGAASLRAALYPAKTNYLYFVSKDGLTHHFSETYAEHLRAIDLYLRR
jgi:UPF0755 protein